MVPSGSWFSGMTLPTEMVAEEVRARETSCQRDIDKKPNMASRTLTLLAEEHKLARVHTLRGRHQSLVELVTVRVLEVDLRQRGATARVVDEGLDYTLDVAVTLGVVKSAELGRTLAVLGVRPEHGPSTLTLTCNVRQRQRAKPK